MFFTKLSDKYGPEYFSHEKFLSHFFNMLMIQIRTDLMLGTHFIYDASTLKLGHIAKISPMVLKNTALIIEVSFHNTIVFAAA